MPRFSPLRGGKDTPLGALTPKQRQFALHISEGKSAKVAAKLAGFVTENPKFILRQPKIAEAVQHLNKKYEESIVADRKMVLEGFLEAIEQAKLMADPAVQIAGWREIGKMCGYYAPEIKKVEINVSAKRLINQLETLPDDKLLEMIENDRAAIEGEVTEVLTAEIEEQIDAKDGSE